MRKLLSLLLFFATTLAFSQGKITGTITDTEMNSPLPGANIIVVGASSGTTTDFDGNFTLNVDKASGKVVISYVGFQKKTISFNVANGQTQNLGTIALEADQNALEEIVVVGKGVIDLERDRATPVAVSTVGKIEIQNKAVGNVEFPEVLKNTPSVYVSNQAGGFGDSQMFLRGFDQTNTAFLLNGQPINGMEDGKMYWSNWSGITDIANAVQVQRGLGSSKLAISSVGGTINLVTKTTDLTEGGFVRFMTGNDSYKKGTISYNSGISDKGWGFSVLIDYWSAHRKYARGTAGEGQNYFFSVGKKTENHNFNFLITGAPQWHDQNYSKSMNLYERYGKKYNNNYGFKDGDPLSLRRNYYHKPVANFNWDWEINDQANLSTVLYASMGRGGGTGDLGNGVRYINYANAPANPTQRGAYDDETGLIDWDYIQNEYNPTVANGLSDGYNGTVLRASVNNHLWYGGVTNFSYDLNNGLSFNVGGDVRFYKGDHFRQLVDLLGLDGRVSENVNRPDNYVVSKTFDAKPWAALFDYAKEGERVAYDNSEWINYQGGFGQVEYEGDRFSAFVQGAFSNQSYEREDRWDGLKSDKENRTGYNLKGGAAFKFDDNNTIFANAGRYNRQPYLDNIFDGGDITKLADPEIENEDITGFEGGYRYSSDDIKVSLNLYYTKWDNRFKYVTGEYGKLNLDEAGFRMTDVAQLHKGIELDFQAKPAEDWKLRGYTSIGDWKYDGVTPIEVRNNDDFTIVDKAEVDLSDVKVGMAPQFSMGFGTTYDVIPSKLSVDLDWNYYGRLYGEDFEDAMVKSLNNETYKAEKLNSYMLFDVGASYNMNVGKNKIVFRGNVYNLFDNEYINQRDDYGYYYGNGLTWNFSAKYLF
ncbi:outer membrane cobalamin receptor [Mesonia hippocampi]|uniref:Outer membrane cobalamin receptor n=1 Tax=Mesonia hippocampi TaxID=1628250 RepID=A0A840ENT8_9FLAO|nr:TonB-dependent receptor [Mesonia hippocampi]MBB4118263.1 outer membrane cobalamin receptor [Mesonia hippocampi]